MLQKITNVLQSGRTVFLTLIVIFAAVVALFQPWNIGDLASHPNPVTSYAEAVQRIRAIQAAETNFNPLCQSKLMTHGDQTERVIVFAHGYTTCPQQFADLGKRFYDLGYNVLILAAPHHGLADRMTDEQGLLSAEELAAYADQMVDIAPGLGKYVVMAGLSMGGVVTGWAAQNRSEIDLAVMVSPAFGLKGIPSWLTVPVGNIFEALPVSYDWWNETLKEETDPLYAYPRGSKHTLSEIMRLGFAARAAAERSAPAARAILVVTNANEPAVNNQVTAQILQLWHAQGARLATDEFAASLRLGHDIINPTDKDGNIEVVYSRLIDLINQ